jgi:hypothetical protein
VAAAGIVLGILVGIDRAFFSGQARFSWPPEPRGAGDRRPLRHFRRPGEPREAKRAHDRASLDYGLLIRDRLWSERFVNRA